MNRKSKCSFHATSAAWNRSKPAPSLLVRHPRQAVHKTQASETKNTGENWMNASCKRGHAAEGSNCCIWRSSCNTPAEKTVGANEFANTGPQNDPDAR